MSSSTGSYGANGYGLYSLGGQINPIGALGGGAIGSSFGNGFLNQQAAQLGLGAQNTQMAQANAQNQQLQNLQSANQYSQLQAQQPYIGKEAALQYQSQQQQLAAAQQRQALQQNAFNMLQGFFGGNGTNGMQFQTGTQAMAGLPTGQSAASGIQSGSQAMNGTPQMNLGSLNQINTGYLRGLAGGANTQQNEAIRNQALQANQQQFNSSMHNIAALQGRGMPSGSAQGQLGNLLQANLMANAQTQQGLAANQFSNQLSGANALAGVQGQNMNTMAGLMGQNFGAQNQSYQTQLGAQNSAYQNQVNAQNQAYLTQLGAQNQNYSTGLQSGLGMLGQLLSGGGS